MIAMFLCESYNRLHIKYRKKDTLLKENSIGGGENMSHERFELCLIIPFRYNGEHYENLGTEKEQEVYEHFEQKKMICEMINAQNFDIWNNAQGGMMKYLEVKQKFRRFLGLHHNGTCRYRLKKLPAVTFKITKAGGWFLRDGNAYITLHIITENLEEDQVLNLKSMLINVRENNKILYSVKIGPDKADEKEITIKGLIRAFLNMVRTIEPAEEMNTYITALSLSYGLENGLNKEKLNIFCENLRMNRKNSFRFTKEIEKKYCYIPREYPYLYWAVSENSLDLTADIKEASEFAPNNSEFIRNQLGVSIFGNYLMIYLYYYSLKEKCTELERQCRMADKNMCMYPQKEAVRALDKDLTEIVTEDRFSHVNTLFFQYLCKNTWNLSERLSKVEDMVTESESAADHMFGNSEDYEVFISYRRKYGAYVARLVYNELRNKGKNVFYDIKTMKTGRFDRQIREAIQKSEYVIAVLTPGCLDKRKDEDWMRKELEFALENDKQIINLLVDGFEFPKELPENLKEVTKRHGIHINAEYIDSSLEALTGQIEGGNKEREEI